MVYGWRGTIGLVKPTFRPGSLEKFIRLMPEGVCVVPRFVGIRAGTATEFDEAIAVAETRVAELADLGVDLVIVQGGPPIMLRGVGFDESLTQRLRAEYGVEVLTATRAQLEAFEALGVRSLAGMTYFQNGLNAKFANFFEEAGYRVTAMKGVQGVAFADAGKIPSEEIYAQAKKVFVESGGDCIYLLGAGWDCLPVIDSLERDLGVPVVTNINADVWAAQRRLRLREPVPGFGRLLEEMP